MKLKDIFQDFRRTKGTFEERKGLSEDGRRRKEAKGTNMICVVFVQYSFACVTREGNAIACVTGEV